MVQPQIDARRTPIEDASVEWGEQDSPYGRWRASESSAIDRRRRQRRPLRRGRVQPVALPARNIVRSGA